MTSTKKKAYENLRYRIITQKLAPGELLKDKDLMGQYGIGRTPLREIITELQNEGLINRVARAGTWVAPMDFVFLKQITEIRIGLEGIAGELAAEKISKDQLEQLEQILAKVGALEAEEKLNTEELIKCESQFHNVIYVATNNQKLETLLKSYQSIGARFWHYLAYNQEELFKQFESQRQMFLAIKKKDKIKCKEIMEQHIRDYMGIIDRKIKLLNGALDPND